MRLAERVVAEATEIPLEDDVPVVRQYREEELEDAL